jgi:PPP family 3-phenylpropionic acid transporter
MPDRFVLRLALFYGAFFVYLGLSMPFIPAWLAAKGLDAGEIGIVLAAPMVVRVIAVPLATRIADRLGMLRRALIAASFASVLGFALVGAVSGFVAILAAYALATAALAPVLPFADAFALRGLKRHAASYGSVRLWGSVTFIIANVGGGLLLTRLGAANVIWAVVAALGLTAVVALALEPLAPEAMDIEEAHRPARSLWRSPGFVAVVLGASLIQASHAVMYGFATLQWSARGIPGPTIGLLWAIGVIAEVALFALSSRLVGWFGAIGLILLGGLGGVVRWTAMAFDPPDAVLPLLQALHALSFAATHLGTMHYLAQAASTRRGATAQGDFVAVQGIVFAVAMVLSGELVEAYGSLAYGAMAVAAAVGAAFAGWALGRREREPAV